VELNDMCTLYEQALTPWQKIYKMETTEIGKLLKLLTGITKLMTKN